MHDFLTDVLHALPADGNQAARWTIKEVPVANLRRFEAGLAKMFEVGGMRMCGPELPSATCRDFRDWGGWRMCLEVRLAMLWAGRGGGGGGS